MSSGSWRNTNLDASVARGNRAERARHCSPCSRTRQRRREWFETGRGGPGRAGGPCGAAQPQPGPTEKPLRAWGPAGRQECSSTPGPPRHGRNRALRKGGGRLLAHADASPRRVARAEASARAA